MKPSEFHIASSRWLSARSVAAWIFGITGLLSYNWWVLLPLRPGLLRSPRELLSDLEVTGQPFAAAMQHVDTLASLLLMAAFLLAGSRSVARGWREWVAMMIFAASGTFGGVFPEACADGINAVCRAKELKFQLSVDQYLHIAAGIFEFASITLALLFAFRRTRGETTRAANTYRHLARSAWVAYPLLGAAYLLNRLGVVMEILFFIGFTVMVLTQLLERTRGYRSKHRPDQPEHQSEIGRRALRPLRFFTRSRQLLGKRHPYPPPPTASATCSAIARSRAPGQSPRESRAVARRAARACGGSYKCVLIVSHRLLSLVNSVPRLRRRRYGDRACASDRPLGVWLTSVPPRVPPAPRRCVGTSVHPRPLPQL